MNLIQEFKEFFLREVPVSTGSKKDNELNFPTKWTHPTKGLVGNRFLKFHYPNQDVFTKLFRSITFKLNPEDRARDTDDSEYLTAQSRNEMFGLQGLTTIATDPQAKSFDNGAIENYTRTVRPSQLPETKAKQPTINSYDQSTGLTSVMESTIASSTFEDTNCLKRNVYRVGLTQQFFDWLMSRTVIPGEIIAYYGSKNSVPTSKRLLLCDGKTIGSSTSNATYKGLAYKELYEVIRSTNRFPSAPLFDNSNPNCVVSLPDLRFAFIRGTGMESWQDVNAVPYRNLNDVSRPGETIDDLLTSTEIQAAPGYFGLDKLRTHNHDVKTYYTTDGVSTKIAGSTSTSTETINTTENSAANISSKETTPVYVMCHYLIRY